MNTDEMVGWIKKAGEAERVSEFSYNYVPDVFLTLAYASKFAFSQIREGCKETRVNKFTRQPEETLNEEKLRLEYARFIIKGWRGVTPEKLNQIVPGIKMVIEKEKLGKNEPFDPAEEIPYHYEIGAVLLQYSRDFENFILTVAGSAENFANVAEAKKSEYENLK
jgi:hypothetical protein